MDLSQVFDLDDDSANPRPVIKLCNLVLSEALASSATAISLALTGKDCTVRYRIDDEWRTVMMIPSAAGAPLINRVRVMAILDRTKGHIRQTGLFRARFQGKDVLFNVEVESKPDGAENVLLHCGH